MAVVAAATAAAVAAGANNKPAAGNSGGGGRRDVFVPCPLDRIPRPTIVEFKRIFKDLDGEGKGYLTRRDVIAALAVNAIPLTELQLTLLMDYLDPPRGGNGEIGEDRFVAGMYALSFQHRDVGDVSVYAVFPDSDFTAETANAWFTVRRLLWSMLDDPSSSITAAFMAYFLSAIILLSVAVFIAGTYRPVRLVYGDQFQGVELFCVIVFTLEYLIRLLCSPQPRVFFFSFFNIIDLASILPYYLELMITDLVGSGAPLLRALRLIRVFRLMKIGRYVAWMRVFGKTVEASARPLAVLAFFTTTMIVFWSTLGYFLERGAWDEATGRWLNDDGQPSPFSSIPAAFWWAIVSMSTVGFGDTYAVTAAGRIMSMGAILTGITLFAIPISIVTGNLHVEYSRMDKMQKLRAEHHAQAAAMEAERAAATAGVMEESDRGAEAAAGALAPAPPPPATTVVAAPTGLGLKRGSAASLTQQLHHHGRWHPSGTRVGGEVDGDVGIELSALTSGSEEAWGKGVAPHHARAPSPFSHVSTTPHAHHTHLSHPQPHHHHLHHARLPPRASPLNLATVASLPHTGATTSTGGGGGGPHAHGEGGVTASRMAPTPRTGAPPGLLLLRAPHLHAGSAHIQPLRMYSDMTLGRGGVAEAVPESPHHTLPPKPNPPHGAGTPSHLTTGADVGDGDAHTITARRLGSSASSFHGPPGLGSRTHSYSDLYHAATMAAGGAAVSGMPDYWSPQLASTTQARLDAAWSEPFLRSSMQVIRGNRRRLMSSLKQTELKNREHAVEDVKDFVADMADPNRGAVIIRSAMASGLIK